MSGSSSVPETEQWFTKEMIWWLSFSCVFWGLVSQLAAILLFLNPLYVTLNPFRGFFAWFHPSFWIYHFLLFTSVSLLAWNMETHLMVKPLVFKGTFYAFKTAIFHYVPSLCLHLTSGSLLIRAYLGFIAPLSGYSHLIESSSVNEGHLFLIQSGALVFGLGSWINFHFGHGNVLDFPLIHCRKKSRIRSAISAIFVESLTEVAHNMRYFLGFYVVYGRRLTGFMSRLFRMETEADLTWSGYFIFLSIASIHGLILNTAMVFTYKLLKCIYNVYLTEPIRFKVEGGPNNLIQGMKSANNELLKHMAFMDFSLIASESPRRREDFFTLSQPGGHPHHWNNVSGVCFKLFQDFTAELNSCNNNSNNNSNNENSKKPEVKEIKAPTLDQNFYNPSNLRIPRLAATVSPGSTPTKGNDKNSGIQDIKNGGVTSKTRQAWNKVSKNPIFSALPDSNVRSVFAKYSQLMTWAVEGLSHLISASIKEDRYGVVQKQLPNLLVSLLNLQQTIERHKGLTVTVRENKSETKDLKLKNELRASVKTALYRISLAYGDHLLYINGLPSEFQQKLKNYHLFME